MFLDNTLLFLYGLDVGDILRYFWAFIFFDFIRYLLLDLLVIFVYFPKRFFSRHKRRLARLSLYHERPLVSVIVPGKNEGRHIPRLASSLKLQNYKNIELIIVDDGSDDNTEIICRQLESAGSIDKFIRNDIRGGKGSAANTALNYANGKYIVHIDADSHLDDNSIETILLPFYMDARVGAVGGDVRVANTESALAPKLQAIEYMKSISTGRTISSLLGLLRIISGAHGAFRKDVLDRLGGWDVGPGLDGDITLKIRKLGLRVVHEPHAICYTHVPVTFSRLAKQRFRWDRSMVRFRMRKHLDILLPSKSFSFKNFLSSFDNLLFNVLLNLKWWVYVIQLMIIPAARENIEYIIFINYILYFTVNLIEYFIACLVYEKTLMKTDLLLIPFLPLMPIYTGVFIRIVRSYAYIMEFINKSSYSDPWNPWKVSKISKQEKL